MENNRFPYNGGHGGHFPQFGVPYSRHHLPQPISPNYSLPLPPQNYELNEMVHYNNYINSTPNISHYFHSNYISEPTPQFPMHFGMHGYNYMYSPRSPPPIPARPPPPPPQRTRRSIAYYQQENIILKTELDDRTSQLEDKNAIVAHIEKIVAAQEIDLAHYREQHQQAHTILMQIQAKKLVLRMYETEIDCLRDKKKTLENVLASTEQVISDARNGLEPQQDLIDVLEKKKKAGEAKLQEITRFLRGFNAEFNAGVETLATLGVRSIVKIEPPENDEQSGTPAHESPDEFLPGINLENRDPNSYTELFRQLDFEKTVFKNNVHALLDLVHDTFEDCVKNAKKAEMEKAAEPEIPKIRLRKKSVSASESETEASPASSHSRSSAGEWSIVSPIKEEPVEIQEVESGNDSEEPDDPPPPVLVPFNEEPEEDDSSVEIITSKGNRVRAGRPQLIWDDFSDTTDQEKEESGKNYILRKFLKHPDPISKQHVCNCRFKSRGSLRRHYLKDHKIPPRQLTAKLFVNNCCKFIKRAPASPNYRVTAK